jgi:hypothetical protein
MARGWFGVLACFKASEPSVDLLGGRMEAGCLILGPCGYGIIAKLFADFLFHFDRPSEEIVARSC